MRCCGGGMENFIFDVYRVKRMRCNENDLRDVLADEDEQKVNFYEGGLEYSR